MNEKLLFALLPFLIAIGCGEITSDNQSELKSEYAKRLNDRIRSLDAEKLSIRDSFLQQHKKNAVYTALYVDSIVSDEYLPVVDELGELLLRRTDKTFAIGEDKLEYISQIQGAKNFLLTAGAIEFKGGYIPEFEPLIQRYIQKYQYYGTVYNTLNTEESSLRIENEYTLFMGALYIDSYDKSALNAMAMASNADKVSWYTLENENGLYMHPQFVNEGRFLQYLKEHYPESSYAPKQDYVMTAMELNAAYQENEISADRQYKGKMILLSGKVTNIAKSAFDKPYITLSSGRMLEEVHCEISEDEGAYLSKYEQVKVLGRCNGMFMGSVFLKNCEVVK
ncbi:MAG TPA: hypothetical protein VIN07_04355 [Flavipsychrobacter sp.]